MTRDCSGEGCGRWTGTFIADNDRREVRHGVELPGADPPDPHGVPAVDTGAPEEVFPVGGGTEWLLYTLIFAIGCLFMAWPVATILWWLRCRAQLPGQDLTAPMVLGRRLSCGDFLTGW